MRTQEAKKKYVKKPTEIPVTRNRIMCMCCNWKLNVQKEKKRSSATCCTPFGGRLRQLANDCFVLVGDNKGAEMIVRYL